MPFKVKWCKTYSILRNERQLNYYLQVLFWFSWEACITGPKSEDYYVNPNRFAIRLGVSPSLFLIVSALSKSWDFLRDLQNWPRPNLAPKCKYVGSSLSTLSPIQKNVLEIHKYQSCRSILNNYNTFSTITKLHLNTTKILKAWQVLRSTHHTIGLYHKYFRP